MITKINVAISLGTALLAFSPHAMSAPSFGEPLNCSAAKRPANITEFLKSENIVGNDEDLSWALNLSKDSGRNFAYPKDPSTRKKAATAARLLRGGNIIAAKMANDAFTLSNLDYKASEFAPVFEYLLTVLTQPVMHGAASESDRHGDADVSGKNKVSQKDRASDSPNDSLTEVVKRADVTRKALGMTYEFPSVRFYLLAQGFKDPVATKFTADYVCDLNFEAAVLAQINSSAKFMARATVTDKQSVNVRNLTSQK